MAKKISEEFTMLCDMKAGQRLAAEDQAAKYVPKYRFTGVQKDSHGTQVANFELMRDIKDPQGNVLAKKGSKLPLNKEELAGALRKDYADLDQIDRDLKAAGRTRQSSPHFRVTMENHQQMVHAMEEIDPELMSKITQEKVDPKRADIQPGCGM